MITFNTGNEKMPLVDVDDIGHMAAALFCQPDQVRTNHYAVSESLNGHDIAKAFS